MVLFWIMREMVELSVFFIIVWFNVCVVLKVVFGLGLVIK